MTLKECIELYQKESDRYKGFKRKSDNYYYYKTDCKYIVEFYIKEDQLKSNNIIFDIDDLLSEDWEMIEDIVIPDGFISNAYGQYRKKATVDVWAIIAWDKLLNKEIVYSIDEKEDKTKFKGPICRYKYIKTLHLSQQYSFSLDDIK